MGCGKHDPSHLSERDRTMSEEQLPADSGGKMVVFGAKQIRCIWVDGQWFFSVVDIIAALTDSDNPRNYWNMMKAREREQSEVQLSTFCVQLKLRVSFRTKSPRRKAGRWRVAHVASLTNRAARSSPAKTTLRISPSPNSRQSPSERRHLPCLRERRSVRAIFSPLPPGEGPGTRAVWIFRFKVTSCDLKGRTAPTTQIPSLRLH